MTYIEAPTNWQRDGSPAIFLAGGITGCPDWQAEAAKTLSDLSEDIVVLKPPAQRLPDQ